MWIVIVRFDFIPGVWCLAFTRCFWLGFAVVARRARYSFATAQKSTQTNFARSKIEQPLFGWPEGQNTGGVL
jgi:hypothetical protein